MTLMVFSDFDDFADSIRGIAGRFLPTAPSERDWWVDVANLGRIEVQQLQIGGASTYAGDGTPNTLTLGIPMTDPTRMRIDGGALEHNSLIFLKRDQPFTFAAQEATRWGGITIHLRDEGREAFDAEQAMASLQAGTRAQSGAHCLARLRQLIARIGAQDGTVGFLDPAAASAAEQDVLDAVSQTIDASSAMRERHLGRPQVPRGRIMSDALALIQAKQGEPLIIDELCRKTGVSERTLRSVFQEFFGVPPMRMLKVRELVEIRSALLAADPARDSVKEIAARFGVWDFSAFSRYYKKLHGESPSKSLSRPPPAKSPAAKDATWLAHVARRFAPFR